MKSQNDRILAALKAGPLDPLAAWNDYGVYRLGARIFDLREAGHNILKRTKLVSNRYGESCRVAEYYIGQ